MKFSSYNLNSDLIEALKELGYVDLTPIQEAVIAKAIKGKSLICKSETGSGKTHAFLVPIFNRINNSLDKIQALIVSPTVELASQTYSFALDIANILGIKIKLLSSSIDKNSSLNDFNFKNEQPKIVIGTPGRIHDILLKNNLTDITKIDTIVLDECDMLLDNAYINQISDLLNIIHPKQRLVFTATMKDHLIADTYKFIEAEEIIDIDTHKVNHNVKHHLVNLKHGDIIDSLCSFLEIEKPFYTMVFASMKTQVDKVYRELNARGIRSALLNGDMESRDRKITMKRIRQGEFNLIICSDIASRGIDLDNVTCVISLDLPSDLDYYYHRAGRTGRNNNKGDSYIFYNDDKMELVQKLIKKNKNIDFDYYVLRNSSLKKVETITGKKKQEKNEVLEAKIKKEIAKVRSKKVKPGYKKKVKEAIKKAKEDHKKQIIKTNIRNKKKENASKGGYGTY
ncbi:MAG: DEAD/DEAH box helicase [Bacillales bacterium]|nr:DEAD/DEAH box helicase [Bacillales bacterium]